MPIADMDARDATYRPGIEAEVKGLLSAGKTA